MNDYLANNAEIAQLWNQLRDGLEVSEEIMDKIKNK